MKKNKREEAPSHVPGRLGDFETGPRTLFISLLALPVGILAAFVAYALLKLIGLITNLVFFHQVAFNLATPGSSSAPWWIIIGAPVVGGLIVGLMARFGSEQIRGHGMPEAIQAILRDGSKIKPKVSGLKPVSSAITIGTGGPFGAEGPIIMTGGAFGSLIAQFLRVTADERKTLLVAGATAGMAATFNAPLASILLAVELLLFEFRPRSFVPVVVAVLVATVIRWPLLGSAALFATDHTLPHLSIGDLLLCIPAGIVGGVVAWVGTVLVYLSEDTFGKLPIHWMWWPAIGGLIIGIGGLIEPHSLGVGYGIIATLLEGHSTTLMGTVTPELTLHLILGILIVKTLIWSLSLGSGTSGGILAPIFMIGAALGALMAYVMPTIAPGFWALMCLAAVVGGVMRSPLTGIIFSLELTHQWDAMFPLIIAATAGHLFSVLTLKRSILTEKVVRNGTHLTREYSVDPLEIFLASEVMPRNFVSFRSGALLHDAAMEAAGKWHGQGKRKLEYGQRLYPVLDDDNLLVGVVTRHQLLDAALELGVERHARLDDVMVSNVVVGYPDMTLREVTELMTEHEISSVPIVDRDNERQILSLVALEHLLYGRQLDMNEARKVERVLHLPRIIAGRGGRLLVRGSPRKRRDETDDGGPD